MNGMTVISKDGKTMTISNKGTGADGKPTTFSVVWDKIADFERESRGAFRSRGEIAASPAGSGKSIQQHADAGTGLADPGQRGFFQSLGRLLNLCRQLGCGCLFGGAAQIAGIGDHVGDGADGLTHALFWHGGRYARTGTAGQG